MARFKNADWNLRSTSAGNIESWEQVHAALLMDLRDELQRLNALLHCPNFQNIPRELRSIKRELATIRKASAK